MNVHPFWILGIVVLVLVIFGPGRLPEIGSAAGRAMREFRRATDDLRDEVTRATASQSPAPVTSTEVAGPAAGPAPAAPATPAETAAPKL